MKTQFKTESGSIYTIDYEARVWARTIETPRSGHLKTSTAVFINVPVVKLGQRVEFWCPPIREGAILRLVSTSPVTEIQSEIHFIETVPGRGLSEAIY